VFRIALFHGSVEGLAGWFWSNYPTRSGDKGTRS
jgi:hypothetical protein